MIQQRRHLKRQQEQEREALMARSFTTNDRTDTAINLDHSVQHHNRLQVNIHTSYLKHFLTL